MGTCRVVYKPDSSIAVIHHAPKSIIPYEAAMESSMRAQGMWGLEYDDVDTSALPQERTYREAWRGEKGKRITIDATVKAEVDARPTEVQAKRAEYYKVKAAIREATAESDTEAVTALQNELDRLTLSIAP